jgi:hypothetical protein
MHNSRWILLLAGLALCGGAARADAQVFTPTFMSPQPGGDVGLYLSDGPGSFAFEGIWRQSFGAYDLGFRAGVADSRNVLLLVGAEFRSPVALDDVPLQIAATAGVQGGIGSGGAAGFQGGVTLGYPIDEGTFRFVPYLHPRIALVSRFGRDEFELDPLADIGFDFILPPNVAFRFAIALGNPGATWGLGLSWR